LLIVKKILYKNNSLHNKVLANSNYCVGDLFTLVCESRAVSGGRYLKCQIDLPVTPTKLFNKPGGIISCTYILVNCLVNTLDLSQLQVLFVVLAKMFCYKMLTT